MRVKISLIFDEISNNSLIYIKKNSKIILFLPNYLEIRRKSTIFAASKG